MIDKKGLTDKEIQEQIDWIIQCRKTDEFMWKLHAQEIIKNVVLDTLKHDKFKKRNY